MKYEKINDTTAFIQTGKTLFRIDANEANFEAIGIEPTEEMIAEEKERARVHRLLIDDFENETNVKLFAELLDANPSTAYTLYINGR